MFDAKELIGPFLAAAQPILKKNWDDVREYATSEAEKMATTLVTIGKLRTAGKIDDDQARALLAMQKHAMTAVLLAVEGIGLIAAQKAITAGLAAIKEVINNALPIPLV